MFKTKGTQIMLVKIISIPQGVDVSLHLPVLLGKMTTCYESGEFVITDGNDEDIQKLKRAGIIVESVCSK